VGEDLLSNDRPTGSFEKVFRIARMEVHLASFANDRQQTVYGSRE
jgi:hypothetical protein